LTITVAFLLSGMCGLALHDYFKIVLFSPRGTFSLVVGTFSILITGALVPNLAAAGYPEAYLARIKVKTCRAIDRPFDVIGW